MDFTINMPVNWNIPTEVGGLLGGMTDTDTMKSWLTSLLYIQNTFTALQWKGRE